MASKESYVFLSFLVLFAGVAAATVAPIRPLDAVRRSSFPKDFSFGTASSAYQYEGAAFEDGKGPSIWDTFTHQHPDKIADRSNADVAVDSYHRYKEDIAIMKHLGFDSYRFSISWSRVLPKGKLSGGVNKKGIDYYNNLINELLANGIQPYVTLFHWDTPQALEDDYKSFLNYSIVHDFGDYADLCFKEFGDRVKHWITFNEPWSFGWKAYAVGQFAPGRCSNWENPKCLGGDSGTEPYLAIHHQILAHGVAAKIYRSKYKPHQKGGISVTLLTHWYTPYSSSEADQKAASRALDFALGWFLHPITYGDYPASMRALVKDRLPKFTKAQSDLLKGSYDFLGMNYYTTNYAKDNPNAALHHPPSYNTDYLADLTTDKNGVSIGPKVNASSWIAVYPKGFKELLNYTKNNYQNPIIYVTENACLDYDTTQIKNLNDRDRIKYFHGHLAALLDAMSDGVRVKGYFAWSLLDNFEWATGYTNRFGLTYIDYKNNLKRIVKDSGKWFQHFLRT